MPEPTTPSRPHPGAHRVRRVVALAAAALLTVIAVGALGTAPSRGATTPYVYAIHFGTPTAEYPVADLTGRVWVHSARNRIGPISAGNTLSFEAASGEGGLSSVAPDGTLWFADITGHIESFSPTTGTAFSFVPIMTSPSSIAVAPDGDVWYASFVHTELGHIHPDGTPVAGTPTVPMGVLGMTRGPDGNIWFSNVQTGHIGWFDPVTGAPLGDVALSAGADPRNITTGPDGNLWFVEPTANRIGRITPAGVITEFALPADLTQPRLIATAADGTVYYSVFNPPNTTDAALGVLSFTVPPPTTTTTTTSVPAPTCGAAGRPACPVGVAPRFTG